MDTEAKKSESGRVVSKSSNDGTYRAPLNERDWDRLRELVRENREINERHAEK